MKKKLISLISMVAVVAMLVFSLTACGGSSDTKPAGSGSGSAPVPSTGSIKIGVLVADVSGEEAQGFRSYYENYIASNYDVQFVYTEQLTDAASEKSAIEKFASQGCSAILSFSSSDRALQIETCEENEIYYAVASGMLDDAQYEENLLDIVKKAGWDVVWYENDDGCKKICNRSENYKSYELGKDSKYCFNDYCYDDVLLEFMDDRLKIIKKNTLIVLHTIGSHGPSYYKRYPQEFVKFKPTCDTTDIQKCSSQELINTYDNTILYTDYIINSAIERLKKYKKFHTSLMYASDHGESLGEEGMYLHGLPYKVAPEEQKRVPFILWLSKSTMKDMNIDFTCLRNKTWDKASHDNWFHTALGLTQTKTSLYDQDLDLVTGCRE